MKESFLHYLWQFQYFDKAELLTTHKEPITILRRGIYNNNAGPDFLNAKIKIGTIEWAGQVEIHIKSSDWLAHKHDADRAYDNVILHVVWEDDKPIVRRDGTVLPTLTLKGKVNEDLITNYRRLIMSGQSIACQRSWNNVEEIVRLDAIEKSLLQRLQTKAEVILKLLSENNHDWDETTYQVLAKNFGFKVNSDPFFELAKSLPYKVIRKHTDNLLQIESLLFGQAGFVIAKGSEAYTHALWQEYQFLKHKYSLDTHLNFSSWKFLRLRPANFPTIRIAQFAAFISRRRSVFSQFIESTGHQEIYRLFDIQTSSYWLSHYRFGKKTRINVPALGVSSVENIIINTAAPLLVAYGKAKDEQIYIDRALEILQHTRAESNKITRQWEELGLKVKTAFDSQGLIELFNNGCQKRNCLNCPVGISILKPLQKI